MTKLKDILELLEGADRIRIIRGAGEELYIGFKGTMQHYENGMEQYMNEEVKKFQLKTEIRHKKWNEMGLLAPLMPEQTPQYSFSDLQMSIYHTIFI